MPLAQPPVPLPKAIIADINGVRRRHGLPGLKPTNNLRHMARVHDHDMLRDNFFSHAGGGTNFVGRVQRSVHYRSVGETIAWTTARATAWKIVALWLHSPPHRAMLLNPAFRRIGVADARGMLGSQRGVVATADFASAT